MVSSSTSSPGRREALPTSRRTSALFSGWLVTHGRMPLQPSSSPLVGVGDAKQRCFLQRAAGQLEAHGKAVGGEPARHRDGGKSRQIEESRVSRESAADVRRVPRRSGR